MIRKMSYKHISLKKYFFPRKCNTTKKIQLIMKVDTSTPILLLLDFVQNVYEWQNLPILKNSLRLTISCVFCLF